MASVKPEYVDGVLPPRPKFLRTSEHQIIRDDLSGLLAHDLKTPLAAISMNLDFALAELDPDVAEGLRSALEDCRQANGRAIRIVSDMADAVRLTMGDRRPYLVAVGLAAIVEGVIERAAADARGRGVRLVSMVDDTIVHADVELLARALDRLVERALRHARAASHVDIEQRSTNITIRVETIADRNELAARTLATYFAEAAMRAQGGGVGTETEVSGALVYRVTFAP